ncbi:MAG: hypothetical protein SH820_13030 [Xanthomonadales bacterium]|nr:hypothetical protein [Xanthomonadales bacterium]
MSFIEELKRRNVFKVGAAYIVMAWLLAQGVDVFLENFGAPDWVIKTVLLLLVAGLPIALFFAWAFELTPEGIKKEKDVDRSQSITNETGRKLDYAIIGVLLVALSWFAYDKFVLSDGPIADVGGRLAADPDPNRAQSALLQKSIAVLPFVNMSEDANNEYFSDGISEEILNSLAKVKELKVAGRTSSFAFKGQNQDLSLIGETLGVENILEGSVRKSGNQIRITAQLIQVEDGFHLWSESYDRELDNVFAIQDEISAAILKELKATLLAGEAELLPVARADSRAYDLYLLAKQRLYDRTRLSIESAAELLDQAIAIDPEYAPAYAQRGTAALLSAVTSYGNMPQKQALSEARLYLDKALLLDKDLAEAWAGLGLYYSGPPPQPLEGIPVLEKAIAINPNLNDAGNWLAMAYWSVNRGSDALALLTEINARDPLYKPAMGNRTFLLAIMGRGDEAREQLAAAEPFMPGDPNITSAIAWIESQEGKAASALQRMQTALELQPTDRVYRVGVNDGYYATHQYEKAFDDEFSDNVVWALYNLDRIEEANIIARNRASDGVTRPYFAYLNASGQSATLVQYFEHRWEGIEDFQKKSPPTVFGYREMADLAYAYRADGNTERFNQAMAALLAANNETEAQGVVSNNFRVLVAAYHAMARNQEQALRWLELAVDGGLIASTRISHDYPYFKEFDGNPEYEAIQARMIEHLNRQRAELGLEPIST